MKLIRLTKGLVTVVDDEDFDLANQFEWYASLSKGAYYARCDKVIANKRARIYLHRILTAALPGETVDHRDRLTLNNQRRNLRTGTQIENMGNCGMQRHNTSGFKGVTYDKNRRKWIALIKKAFGTRRLGRFNSARDAAIAYDQAAVKKYGEFALTNKLLGLL